MTKTKADARSEFRPNEYVVYPAHGVGRILRIETQEIAGMRMELFVISFEKDKMTLRVPTAKATSKIQTTKRNDTVTKSYRFHFAERATAVARLLFRRFYSEALQESGQLLRSRTGELGRASISSISITVPRTDMILHRLIAIRLGRTGEWVAKTPLRGFCAFPWG